MKILKTSLRSLALILLAALSIQCSDDNDVNQPQAIPQFSEADKSIIHGDSQKSWRITEVINNYYDPSYDLEITLDCVTDDVYTFHSETEEVSIDYGDVLCFDDIDDGIFTADHEFFESNLLMLGEENEETIYLHFARGYMNENQTAQGVTFTYYRLAELSETRMVFTRGAEVLGNYKKALVFTLIE